jgi:hypothetical protein
MKNRLLVQGAVAPTKLYRFDGIRVQKYESITSSPTKHT